MSCAPPPPHATISKLLRGPCDFIFEYGNCPTVLARVIEEQKKIEQVLPKDLVALHLQQPKGNHGTKNIYIKLKQIRNESSGIEKDSQRINLLGLPCLVFILINVSK